MMGEVTTYEIAFFGTILRVAFWTGSKPKLRHGRPRAPGGHAEDLRSYFRPVCASGGRGGWAV